MYVANKPHRRCDVDESAEGLSFELRVEDEPGNPNTPVYAFSTTIPALRESGVPAA